MKKFMFSFAALALGASAFAAMPLDSTNRLVVKFKPTSESTAPKAVFKAQLAGKPISTMKFIRKTHSGSAVYDIGQTVTLTQAQDIARRLAADPNVESVTPDFRVKAKVVPPAGGFVPQDPYYGSNQWSLKSAVESMGGMNAPALWQRTLGAGAKVAVLDTGTTPHPELAGRIIAGYDFVSDLDVAGDANGRDADPTDPGDFCTVDGVLESASSWHGTLVAGVIAAATDTTGITGVAPQASIVDVRVLGRCGGWATDLADGIAWAGGVPVAGAPVNPHGPMVINMSLGSAPGQACPAFMQTAIDQALARGAIIVAATGNDGVNDVATPANCAGVISVSAHTGNGDLASYANYTTEVTVSGPAGGDCKSVTTGCQPYPSVSLGVRGSTVFESFRTPVYFAGTSSATPFVAATVAMMRELEPTITAADAKTWLKNTSRPFPAGTYCYGNTNCGFGMLDAEKLLQAMDDYYAPTLVVDRSHARVKSSQSVTLSASASSKASGKAFTYSWTQVSGPAVTLSSSGVSATFVAPQEAGTVVVRVTATDSANRTVQDTVQVEVYAESSAPVVSPVPVAQANVGQAWSLTPQVSDLDGDANRLVIVSAPEGVVAQGLSLVWPTPVAGSHLIKFVAVDAQGLESAEMTFTLNVGVTDGGPQDTTPPTSAGGGGGGGAWGLLGGVLMMLAFGLKQLSRNRVNA